MKLARPDVFHPRVVLAGWPQQPAGDGDDAGLVAALRHRGLHAGWLSWDDPEIVHADLVILRATRDYPARLDEFLAWTTRVANLLNSRPVVAWNVERRYLRDLMDRGCRPCPARCMCRESRSGCHAKARSSSVRPSVPGHGAVVPGSLPSSSRNCTRPARRCSFSPEVPVTRPCWSSLAVSRRMRLPSRPTRRQTEPDFEIWDVGAAAVAGAAAQVGVDPGELLYARAHITGGSRDPRLLELQLVDPSLGWQWLDPDIRNLAQRDFALCVQSALERLGLGPFSHRRP